MSASPSRVDREELTGGLRRVEEPGGRGRDQVDFAVSDRDAISLVAERSLLGIDDEHQRGRDPREPTPGRRARGGPSP